MAKLAIIGFMDIRTRLQAPRFTRKPFPPYRFTPGRDPHPTNDPRGHSYLPPGQAPPKPILPLPQDWARNDDYLYGCDLYNHGYWWEAHEAWEGLWQLTDKNGLQGRFLQGLIQVAACHLKLYVGKLAGARRLLKSGLEYLQTAVDAGLGESYMGLSVARFSASVRSYYDARLSDDPAGACHEIRAYPYILLS